MPSAIVRELHVYGPLVPVGKHSAGAWQHKGFGADLLKEAERMALEDFGVKKLLVISALGTRRYYMRFGYERDGVYVSKKLENSSMSQLENSGYKGSALQALKKADCDVGDIIRVTSKGKTYEGILIPRSELGEGTVVIVKMKSGYNIGIRVTAGS